MHDFHYSNDRLFCEGVAVQEVAANVATPFYLYSRKTLAQHFTAFDGAFSRVPHLTCYSVKSNSNLAVLSVFARLGSGADVVSGGEIFRATQAGVPPEKMVYSGVGKRRDEIEYALATGILMFNVESFQELELINTVAGERGLRAPVALRINPDVDPKTHPYISTGLKKNKFGIPMDEALEAYRQAAGKEHIAVVGVDCHIGSQITEVSPFVDALHRVKAFIGTLLQEGVPVRYLDIGGGLGITYDAESPPDPAVYAAAILEAMGDLPCTLILEPGRVIAGNAGILVSRVLYTKQSGAKKFVIVDAGMNDLVRPSLYDAYHNIQPVLRRGAPDVTADIVGPICETGDFLARDRRVADLQGGDLLAVMSAGAYGFTMASNYNSRPRVPEVLVDGERYFVIRKRETYADLVRLEDIPEELSS